MLLLFFEPATTGTDDDDAAVDDRPDDNFGAFCTFCNVATRTVPLTWTPPTCARTAPVIVQRCVRSCCASKSHRHCTQKRNAHCRFEHWPNSRPASARLSCDPLWWCFDNVGNVVGDGDDADDDRDDESDDDVPNDSVVHIVATESKQADANIDDDVDPKDDVDADDADDPDDMDDVDRKPPYGSGSSNVELCASSSQLWAIDGLAGRAKGGVSECTADDDDWADRLRCAPNSVRLLAASAAAWAMGSVLWSAVDGGQRSMTLLRLQRGHFISLWVVLRVFTSCVHERNGVLVLEPY